MTGLRFYLENYQYRIIFKMFNQNYQFPAYSSLNNSTVLSPNHNHARAHSNTRPHTPLTFQTQHTRVPSQKKLTLTCQNQLPLPKILQKQPELTLKKRGGQCTYNKGKFVSLQASRIAEPQALTTKRDNQADYLTELKRGFRDKIRELQSAYSHNLKEYSNQVRELQIKLLGNSRELQAKESKIKELEDLVKQYKNQSQNTDNSCFMSKRIGQLEKKIRVIASYIDDKVQKKGEQPNKIDILSQKIINHFGARLHQQKKQMVSVLSINFARISELESELQFMRNRQEKGSQGTRGSTASMCSSDCPNFHFPKSHQNMSFFDDTFFIPNQHSENYDFVHEMAQRRAQPLSCWIDHQDFLRYSDTNSYLYNRRGDRIKLDKEEIQELVCQNILMFS